MIKAYFIMRKDLNMTPAKLAVQVGHGTQYLLRGTEHEQLIKDWVEKYDSRKVVCEISSLEKLENLQELLSDDIEVFEIVDSGYTEFNGKTKTGICLFYDDEFNLYSPETQKKIKRLQLYK